jgi:predicted metal-dependent hydrolase
VSLHLKRLTTETQNRMVGKLQELLRQADQWYKDNKTPKHREKKTTKTKAQEYRFNFEGELC